MDEDTPRGRRPNAGDIPRLLTELLDEQRRTNELLAEFLKDWRAVNEPPKKRVAGFAITTEQGKNQWHLPQASPSTRQLES